MKLGDICLVILIILNTGLLFNVALTENSTTIKSCKTIHSQPVESPVSVDNVKPK